MGSREGKARMTIDEVFARIDAIRAREAEKAVLLMLASDAVVRRRLMSWELEALERVAKAASEGGE